MKKINSLLILIISLVSFIGIVNADMGAKPSINIKIDNLNTTNYVIDILIKGSNEDFNSEINYNGEDLNENELNDLHKIKSDGYIAEATRWDSFIIFNDCKGNSNKEHYFNYFGIPDEYKIVIINYDTNETKISEVIERKAFASEVTIDYNTMKIVKENKTNIVLQSITDFFNPLNFRRSGFIVAILITVVVELIIALLFKIKHTKCIIITNVITNIGLQIVLIAINFISPLFGLEYLDNPLLIYTIILLAAEVFVIIAEILTYLKVFKDVSKKKTIIYTLIANLITILLTYII